jgi:hypothetical protein
VLAERGDGPCVSGRPAPVAVAVEGGAIAVAEVISDCDTAETAFRIVVRQGTATTDVPAGGWVQGLAVSGTQLAWTTSVGERLTVRDLASAAPPRRLGRRRLHGAIEDLDVAADGGVALTIGTRLAYLAPGSSRVRVLDRRVDGRDVALYAGRVLYERRRDRAGRRTALVVRQVAGGRARRLASFRPGHRRVGHLDLDATRATWAVRAPRPRIVVASL